MFMDTFPLMGLSVLFDLRPITNEQHSLWWPLSGHTHLFSSSSSWLRLWVDGCLLVRQWMATPYVDLIKFCDKILCNSIWMRSCSSFACRHQSELSHSRATLESGDTQPTSLSSQEEPGHRRLGTPLNLYSFEWQNDIWVVIFMR